MALHFITGTATTDHDLALAQRMNQLLQADSQAQILEIVPNHIKFDSEVDVLKTLRDMHPQASDLYTQNRVQIMSFSRLAWFYLKNEPIFQKPRLSPDAMSMRLAKIMAGSSSQLHLFASQVGNPGFAARLQQQISELQMGRVTATDLDAAIGQLTSSSNASRYVPKLRDLAIIMKQFDQETQATVTQPELLAALADKLDAMDLSHLHVFIAHFNALAAQELNIVGLLMQKAASVTVALVTDTLAQSDTKSAGQLGQIPDLYQPAKQMAAKLVNLAQENHVTRDAAQPAPERQMSITMHNVERYFQLSTKHDNAESQPNSYRLDQSATKPAMTQLTLAEANTPYTELRHVAREILKGIHDGNRYSDYLVLARRLKPYETIVDAVFKEFGLPYFIDHERQMTQHPLIVFIDSLFGIAAQNYDYQNIFSLLRTELLVPEGMSASEFRRAVDVTENYVLASGVRGSMWTKDEPWAFYTLQSDDDLREQADADDEKTTQINLIKDIVAHTVAPVINQLQAKEQTGQQLATTLYSFITTARVRDHLQAWRDDAENAGDLAESQASEQAWQQFCDLLDDFVTAWGEETITSDQFLTMLDAGFASANYTQIPATLDQVQVSETGLARRGSVKHVFLIGATAQALPEAPSDNELLNQNDRSALEKVLPEGCFLPSTGTDSALGEPFLNYLALMTASDQLTVSYPQRTGDGDGNASPYFTGLLAVSRLSKDATHADRLAVWNDADSTLNADSEEPTALMPVSEWAGSPRSTLSDLIAIRSKLRDLKQKPEEDLNNVADTLHHTNLDALTTKLLSSLTYDNGSGFLHKEITHELYGDHLSVTVSRLATFYKNPFEYFLRFGLQLQPRREFTLTPADAGILFHAVMEQLLKGEYDPEKQETIKQLGDLSDAELNDLINRLVGQELKDPNFAILTSSARMQYITQLLLKTIRRTGWAVRNEQRDSQFRGRASEVSFGMGNDSPLAAIKLPTGNGRYVSVRGRIDRVDELTEGNQTAFMVVDYKSSEHTFDPSEAYYGRDMQMLTYIEAMLTNAAAGTELIPVAGMFMHLQNPTLDYQPLSDDGQVKQQLLTDLTLQQMKMHGIIVQGPFVKQLDMKMDNKNPSKYFSTKINGDGKVIATGSKVTPEQMQQFLANNDALIRRAAAKIQDGVIDLSPSRYDRKSDVITKSDFASVMQFDPFLAGNTYRPLQKLKLKEVLANLAAGIPPYTDKDDDDKKKQTNKEADNA
ncbi:exodeoxyribonuclease V subunit gamma [Lacticaseibacillus pabuli]|uniref:Exodeoxyribonuclease V subunit gamma n=1 Tax=Lacticaseibacillus pabuli TaxID=3025672 RepID=A0ABY7WN04_9LACO|nr:PD-(D/E)XK nuclease family protein [Lacticaseibacillus sp. KACC 23028]WDF81511.1 exodeoxyribonuclease V subunit gamma [Lacticaseibacillus sp. KACC 23028]